jgi:hypothetical protein
MAITRKQRNTKDIKPFDDQPTELASGKPRVIKNQTMTDELKKLGITDDALIKIKPSKGERYNTFLKKV